MPGRDLPGTSHIHTSIPGRGGCASSGDRRHVSGWPVRIVGGSMVRLLEHRGELPRTIDGTTTAKQLRNGRADSHVDPDGAVRVDVPTFVRGDPFCQERESGKGRIPRQCQPRSSHTDEWRSRNGGTANGYASESRTARVYKHNRRICPAS